MVSSNACMSSSKTIRNVSVCVLKVTVFFLKPTKENSNVPLVTGKSMANHPCELVAVPKDTPATFTVTPGMGTLCISYTNPFTRNDFFSGSSGMAGLMITIRSIYSQVNLSPNICCNTSSIFEFLTFREIVCFTSTSSKL